MITHHTNRGLVWLDVVSPTDDEVTGLIKRYDLHPLVGEELKVSSSRAKIDFYDDYILIVLTLPVRSRKGAKFAVTDREIDFVIGKNFLITARDETIEQLEYFSKIFDTNAILNKNETEKIEHAGHLFYYMVQRIYRGMREDLENIRDALTTAETKIFNGEERKMVEVLSHLSRELIDFRQTARIHREIWTEMVEHEEKSIFSAEFSKYIEDLRDEFNEIHDLIANAHELLADLRETNDSLLNTKQNEIIKILTLVAFFFSPLTFLAAVFTIPAKGIPIIESPQGWITILILMAMVAIGILYFFKKRRWM